MKTIRKFTFGALAAAVLFGLGACAGMSKQEQQTAIVDAAGSGAVGAAILKDESAVGSSAEAAVGGVIGGEVGKK
ncbi:osmotically-inducible lipoprotein B [Accumulibacter sp.]|uniref:osmotically-inducible lipoprotein B n=1 Tax=Accumulibacter sp. TaxID=2053492 RepID=UPI0028C50459|nr:osmotically-inducible lipoprotein B [Accumulibacter sp.]